MLQGRSRALFVGAGASVALQAPRMSQLFEPIAEYALANHGDQGSRSRDVADYLHLAHGVTENDLSRLATGDTGRVPSIEEVLTSLDLAIAESVSLGYGARRPNGFRRPFDSGRLQRVQRAMVRSIATFVGKRTSLRADATDPKPLEAYRRLIAGFADEAIITTNWDTVIDRLLWNVDADNPGDWRPSDRRVSYTPVSEVIVNAVGDAVTWPPDVQVRDTPFMKLHGSLNWLCCPRCQTLMVNPVLDLADETESGPWHESDCWCATPAELLIITPGYAKDYAHLQIQVIWREALQALALADEWTFIGYSLSMDDFAIRDLVSRALAWKRASGRGLKAVHVFDYVPEAYVAEAELWSDTLLAPPELAPEPVKRFAALAQRYRAILGDFRHGLTVRATGLEGAAKALD